MGILDYQLMGKMDNSDAISFKITLHLSSFTVEDHINNNSTD